MGEFLTGVLIPFLIVATAGGLLLLQPDFGTTVILMSVVFFQLFTVARLRHLIAIGLAGVVALGVMAVSSPYRFRRLESFLDPFKDASATGYQLIQSLIAVGSGGLFGQGLGASKQKLFYLPASHTDFIFAVIVEELGLVGALFVVGLFVLIAVRGLRVARRLSADGFLSSLALGCTLIIVLPALLNMGVVLGLFPTKGLVLPLVAYGGTAMIVHLAAYGILLRLSRMDG
jgi:cell division protein FtsW